MLDQINLVVRDLDAAVAFYRRLGLVIVAEPGAFHAETTMANGIRLEFDTYELVRSWDSGWKGPLT